MQILAEDVFGDEHRAHAGKLGRAFEFLAGELHVLHRQHDAAVKLVRIFVMRRDAGIGVRGSEFKPEARRRPIHQRIGHRQRVGVALALFHVGDDVVEVGHGFTHHRGLRAIGHRQHYRVALGVLAHLRAMRRAFFDHQIDEFLRIPMHVRIDHTRVTARAAGVRRGVVERGVGDGIFVQSVLLWWARG